ACKRIVHFSRWHNQIANHSSFRRIAIDPATHQDGLARNTVAGKAWHAQVGSARNNAFLARGKCHVSVAARYHIVRRQKVLTATTDRPTVDCGDPSFFKRPTIDLVGARRARCDPSENLVHDTHIAADLPEIGNLAVIDVGKIDPARKNLAAFVFRMIDGATAQYANLAQRVQNSDIGSGFRVVECVVVLGIEETRILYSHYGGLTLAFDPG